jgi:Xaa-Pro aminopeptidase
MATLTAAGPTISLRERDRRHAAIKEALRERGVDAAILTGTNLFYVTNGLPGEQMGVFPTADAPQTVFLNPRHLVDLSSQVLIDAQEWVKDIRAGEDAKPIVERLRELRLERGTIGVTGSRGPGGGLSQRFMEQLAKELPDAKVVDVTDVFLNLRTIKSAEEIAMIEHANILFDLAVERVQQVVRPGMTGRQAVQEAIKAMWEAGGDVDSTVGFNFGPVPAQNPILGALCWDKPIQPGDVGTLTAHAEYRNYAGHSDQEVVFGESTPLHREMFTAVLEVRDEVLKAVKPGTTHGNLVDIYREACTRRGYRWSPHSQMHQYGIDVPEFPGPAFNVGPGDGRRSDFVLKPGMVYSISPTLLAPNSDDTLLGGTCLVVTETGYRDLGDRKVEMLIAKD